MQIILLKAIFIAKPRGTMTGRDSRP